MTACCLLEDYSVMVDILILRDGEVNTKVLERDNVLYAGKVKSHSFS
jgi:hypothetical protein